MRIVLGLLLLAGCDTLFGLQHVPTDADGVRDAEGPDAGPADAPPGMTCAGSLLRHCEPTAQIGGSTYTVTAAGSTTIDTDSSACRVLSQPNGGPDVCALVYDDVQIDGTITVTGSRPLAIYAMSQIEVSGTIDVSSHGRSGARGAGASSTCAGTAGASSPTLSSMHSGGGGGGSFGTAGGAGGAGEDMSIMALPGPGLAGPLTVRGGCDGGAGGTSYMGTKRATGGAGGGGLYIATNGTAMITGKLLANGAGGGGGPGDSTTGGSFLGGGAGGSGGLIVIDGTLTVGPGGLVMATGGGGGGGSYAMSPGSFGDDPDPTKPLLGAAGGMPGLSGTGNGGGGGAMTAAGAGSYSAGGGGGGGGGGGAGIVRLPVDTTNNGTVVP